MLALVTEIDSICFVLFHVEHYEGEPWCWRWRMKGDLPAPYLEWREGGAERRFARFQPESAGCGVEVQWRTDPEKPWFDARHLRLSGGTCRFRLTAKVDIDLPADRHELLGRVREHGVARYYHTGPIRLAAGESKVVTAFADSGVLANLLFEPGEFQCWDHRLIVRNIEPTRKGWVPEPGPAVLRRAVVRRPRLYAFGQPEEAGGEP